MARILQLTDLHVTAPGRLASDVLDTRAIMSSAIDRLIERRSSLGPLDALLVTGDVSDDGTVESYAPSSRRQRPVSYAFIDRGNIHSPSWNTIASKT